MCTFDIDLVQHLAMCIISTEEYVALLGKGKREKTEGIQQIQMTKGMVRDGLKDLVCVSLDCHATKEAPFLNCLALFFVISSFFFFPPFFSLVVYFTPTSCFELEKKLCTCSHKIHKLVNRMLRVVEIKRRL